MNKVKILIVTFMMILITFFSIYVLYMQHVLKSISTEDDIYKNPFLIQTLELISRNSIEKNLNISLPKDVKISRLILDEDNSLYVEWRSSSLDGQYDVAFSDISNLVSIKDIFYIGALSITPQPYTYKLIEPAADCLSRMIGETIPQDAPITMSIFKNMEDRQRRLTLQLSWSLSKNNSEYENILYAVYVSRECNLEDFELSAFELRNISDNLVQKNPNFKEQSEDMLEQARNFVSYVENLPCSNIDYMSLDNSLEDHTKFYFMISEKNSSIPKYVVVCIKDSGISSYQRLDSY